MSDHNAELHQTEPGECAKIHYMRSDKSALWFWVKAMCMATVFTVCVCASIICWQPTHLGPAHKPQDPREPYDAATQPTTRPLTIHDYHRFWDSK